MSMSRCSSSVFTVKGRVGLVEDGSTLASPATLMMSGACPPPAPSVWKAWMVRPLKAAIVSSTKPDFVQRVGVDHHLHVVVIGDREAAVDGGGRGAPVLVQLQRAGAGLDHLHQRARASRRCPCRRSRGSSGNASAAWIIRAICQGPGVQVVALVPAAGPVPPPSIVVTPDISASSICCGQMKWMWLSKPPAVRILPSPAITSVPGPMMMVDARLDVRIAGLADGGDAAVLDADIGLHDAPVVHHDGVGDHRVDGALRVRHLRLAHAVADDLAAAELHLLAIDREVLLDLDGERRIREADLVARRGAEHVARRRRGKGWWPWSVPSRFRACPSRLAGSRRPRALRRAREWTSRVWPGSNRMAVPAATSRRMPRALARSKESAGFVSKKW